MTGSRRSTRHLRDVPARGLARAEHARPHGKLDPTGGVPRNPMLGLVVNLRYPENIELVAEARLRGAESGCTMLIADANQFIGREESYERLILERRVDGLLIGTFMPTTAAIAAIARQRLPLVLVNRRIPWLAPGVAVDDEAGMRVAVDHLVRLGHRRIAYVTGPGEADTVHRRLEGFRHAIGRSGVRLRSDYVVSSSADPDEGPARAMAHLLRLDQRPTAVVLWTIGDAANALHAVRCHGLSVPRDLSLVAFNDAPPAAYFAPPLTVVRMPLAELADRAVGTLFDALRGRGVPGDVFVATPPVLVERDSTGPPPSRL